MEGIRPVTADVSNPQMRLNGHGGSSLVYVEAFCQECVEMHVTVPAIRKPMFPRARVLAVAG